MEDDAGTPNVCPKVLSAPSTLLFYPTFTRQGEIHFWLYQGGPLVQTLRPSRILGTLAGNSPSLPSMLGRAIAFSNVKSHFWSLEPFANDV